MLHIDERDVRRHGPGRLLAVCWRQWRAERALARRGVHFRTTDLAALAAAYAAMSDGEFDAVNGRQDWANWRTIPRSLSGHVPDRPLRVLDLGCGTGGSTRVLAFYCPAGSAITGYKVYRRTAGTSSALLATGSTLSYSDSQIQAGQTYFYRVSAVNAKGEGPLSNEVSPVPPPPVADACKEPGIEILSDGTGDSTGGDPAKDVQWLSIAEPKSIGSGRIEFTLKTASLQSVPRDTTWPIVFQTPDGTDRFVRMASDALGNVTFGYGTGTSGSQLTSATAADPASIYNADGTIRIIVPRAAIGNLNPGDKLTQFLVRIRGPFAETAGGVTVANHKKLARAGAFDPDETIVAIITGNGLKTQAAVYDRMIEPIRVGASLSAFEAAYETRQNRGNGTVAVAKEAVWQGSASN